jgi:peptide/nickel transport system substrate-binding protein
VVAAALLVLAALAAACSSSEAPAPPTPTPINVAEIIQQTMQAQPEGMTAADVASEVQKTMAGQQGVTQADVADAIASALSQQQDVTPADIASAVQGAMAAQPGVTQAEVADAIAKAMAGQQGVTPADVASAVQGAMASQPGVTQAEVAEAIAKALAAQPGVTQAEVAEAISNAMMAQPGVTQADIAAAVESAVAKAAPAAMAPKEDESMMMVKEEDRYGGTLRVVSQASIKSLDPDFCTSYVCWQPSAGPIIESLFTQGADFSTQPQLVDSWDISDDGLTWTINLREGITFHDGTPLTSEAAILSQRRILTDTPAGNVLTSFLVEDGMQAVDDLSYTIETTEPYGSLLDGMALRTHGTVLVYTPTAAAFPQTEDVGEENIIGTGPYQLDSWDVGVKVTIARFDDFQSRTEPASWLAGEKKAYLDKIEWLEIPSEETKVAGLKTGEWDFIDSIGLDFVADLKEDPDVGFTWYPGHMWYFAFNSNELEKEPFDSLLLRQAIQASMSGVDMLSAIGPSDTWKLNCSIYGSGTVFESDAGCDLYNQDNVEKGKELLAQSGYNGEPIVILNPTDYSTITPVGPVIKARMEDIGINVDMPGMDWATATSKRLAGEGWHIFTSWGTIRNRQNPAFSFMLAGGGTSIGFGYYNEEIHQLHDKFLRATDFETQQMLADGMQQAFMNDPPQVYSGIFFMPSAYRTWVHDVPAEHPGSPQFTNVWISR